MGGKRLRKRLKTLAVAVDFRAANMVTPPSGKRSLHMLSPSQFLLHALQRAGGGGRRTKLASMADGNKSGEQLPFVPKERRSRPHYQGNTKYASSLINPGAQALCKQR